MIMLNQTSVLLILFSASLCGIIVMIGRKLALVKEDELVYQEEVLFEVPYLREVKHITIKGIKKHGYDGLVGIIRLYVRTINFSKSQYQRVKTKIQSKKDINSDKKEISKFLKIIADYKHKIREIKHRIKKEENL